MTFIWVRSGPAPIRFGTIDGLRGYLAYFVFLHHAAIWYTYSSTAEWKAPASSLYNHLGQSSVALFFMITSFLFYDKLLRTGCQRFDWRAFLVGRGFRLIPLYVAVMLAIFVLVAVLSAWKRHDTPRRLMLDALAWLSFTIPGAPVLNGVNASLITAGITWSLPYEWCFYLLLPVLALSTGQRPGWLAVVMALAGLAIAWQAGLQMHLLGLFGGGVVAARLVQNQRFVALASRRLASVMVIACLAGVLQFSTAFALAPGILLTIAFCLIAGGADLFGGLTTSTSRRLGELAYSIYLLHGILLFVMAVLVIGTPTVATLSGPAYWMAVAALVPVLLGLAAMAFHAIERPGILLGNKFGMRRPDAPSAMRDVMHLVDNAH